MKHYQFTISSLQPLSTINMIQQSIQLNQQQKLFYQQHNTIYQQFQISIDNHHWIILKNTSQVKDFYQYLNKIYQPVQNKQPLIIEIKNKFIHKSTTNTMKIKQYVHKIIQFISNQDIDFSDQKIISFLEIQDLEFNKIKSFKLNKKAGGRYVDKLCCNCSSWKQRYFVITQNGLLYYKIHSNTKKICQYISFNKYFQFQFGISTGYSWGILVKSYHRRLQLKAKGIQQFVLAIYFMKKAFDQYNVGRHFNKYGAFSAPKDNNEVQFLVDGQQYFASVAKAIAKAKHQVMIAGWWISPEFYLIRPIDPKCPQKNRLSTILKQIIAKNNVKIYILAYQESPLFLPNDSKYTKQALQSISPNIKVITHPNNLIPSLWSHHQKIVLVDQKVAFIGGLDLCYGRYDTSEHSIRDKQNLYPGIEFNNSRIKDFQKVRQYEFSNIMRSKHPRLPWHDVGMKIIGGSVSDIVKHFVEYWNFASYESLYQQRIVLVPQQTKIKKKIKNIVNELKNKIWNMKDEENKNKQKQKKNTIQKTKKWKQDNDNTLKGIVSEQMQEQTPNKNLQKIMKFQNNFESGQQNKVYRYANEQILNKNSKQPSTNQTLEKLKKQQSLPQKLSLKKNIKKFFVPNKKDQQEYYNSDNGQYLNQRSYDFQEQHQNVIRKKRRQMFGWIRKAQSHDQRNIGKKKDKQDKQEKSVLDIIFMQKIDACQVLRSVAKWSIGCKETQSEASIHEAYLDMIKKAEHFIYIENQFFMSSIQGQKVLKNLVAKSLINRIEKAIIEKKKFKVVIFMPLIPGFAGQLDEADAILPRVIMHWQYLTIFNGQNSIIKTLLRSTPDPSKYIQFYGLRTHDLIKNEPKTQIVYIHTKLMIVDDKKAILGSANINDRSMRGTRDSQIAVMLCHGKQTDSIINGKQYKVIQKIKNLRIKLMKQHFGLKDQNDKALDFTDMLNSKLCQNLQKMARQNTQTYRKLFGCYPDNQIQTLKDLFKLQRKPTTQQYVQLSKLIKGNVVHYPYKFLNKQNLLEGNSMYPNAITT